MTAYDHIVIDESFMTDNPLIKMIYHKRREYKGVVILIGDIRQNSYLLERREIDDKMKPIGFKLPAINPSMRTNICFTNKKRIEVNDFLLKR
jgi:hypothetical protein